MKWAQEDFLMLVKEVIEERLSKNKHTQEYIDRVVDRTINELTGASGLL